MRPEDKVEIFSNQFRIIRGRAVFEIIFDKEVALDLRELDYKNQRATLHQLTADTYDELSYTIVAYTREPELREPSSVVQVEMDDTTATDNSGAAGGDSDLIDSDTPVSWDELDLSGEVSRAQYTAALVDAIGMVGDPARFKEFADVPRDAWYREQILTAVQMGLIIGVDDTHFAPEKPITAEERELILKRAKAFLTGKLVMVEDMNDGK